MSRSGTRGFSRGLLSRRRLLRSMLGSALGLAPGGGGRIFARSVGSGFPSFADVTARSKIDFYCEPSKTSQKYLIETMVGGVAMFDYDGDGRLDLFFVNGAALDDPMPKGKEPDKSRSPLLEPPLPQQRRRHIHRRHRKGGSSAAIPTAWACAVGDLRQRRPPDLYVTNFGRNILYHNNGDGTFTDVTEKPESPAVDGPSSACFVDYDRDGLLDLLVAATCSGISQNNPWCGEHKPGATATAIPDVFKPTSHTAVSQQWRRHLHRRLGEVGIARSSRQWPRRRLQRLRPRRLARPPGGQRQPTPAAVPQSTTTARSRKSRSMPGWPTTRTAKRSPGMGVDFDDYDNDGWPDVFIGALANQTLCALTRTARSISTTSPGRPGSAPSRHLIPAGALKFVDYDNDGWKDLFIAQSHVMDNIEKVHRFSGISSRC